MVFSTQEFLLFTQELINFTQQILPLLPKKLRTPYSRNLSVPTYGYASRRGVVGRVPARFRFPAGSGILIFVLGLGVCPLSVFCPVLSPADALTLC